MRNRPATAIAALLIVAISAVVFIVATRGLGPTLDARLHEEIGRALAQETRKLVGVGGRVTVLMRDTSSFKQPAADAVLAGFQKEASRAGISGVSLQLLQIDPLRPVQVPSGDFIELIRRGAPADVIVSFMGPPRVTATQRAALGIIRPKIVAFCPGELSTGVDLRELHDQQLLHAAVVERNWRGKSPTPGLKPRPKFDALYLRAGPTEFSQLGTQAGSAGLTR